MWIPHASSHCLRRTGATSGLDAPWSSSDAASAWTYSICSEAEPLSAPIWAPGPSFTTRVGLEPRLSRSPAPVCLSPSLSGLRFAVRCFFLNCSHLDSPESMNPVASDEMGLRFEWFSGTRGGLLADADRFCFSVHVFFCWSVITVEGRVQRSTAVALRMGWGFVHFLGGLLLRFWCPLCNFPFVVWCNDFYLYMY